ncbi:uncharacterized oxidoreductase At4g09670-like [Impatiens glandulifera]|uniref:uncharacterized oxidoreductase At4g09670-like n=1 Tax=Impatiens glandulifera TaxID=253017 RepID=UPI001FB05784|nr:uncharacterized oxidoreductase At4g09670-like [Impatiens glandulifera]
MKWRELKRLKKWATISANRKKHVLLEKPVALNTAELDKILEDDMDSTMWMHHPRTMKMNEFLSDLDRFSQIKSIHSILTYKGDSEFIKNDIRVQPDLDSLGVLGDVVWYCIRAILWCMNYDLPEKVTAIPDPEFNEIGVLLSCSASLTWGDGRSATFYRSFLANHAMDIRVLGSKGDLRVHDFVIPFEEKGASFYIVSNSNWSNLSLGWEPMPSECIVETDLPQEALMAREFSRLVSDIIFEGSKPEMKWVNISRKTQLVIDAVKMSLERAVLRLLN